MTESDEHPAEPAVADVVIKKKRGLPIVWLVPIVAAAVGGWLWWQAVQERGPSVQITFETGGGLEAGKSKVKYNDIEIGEVEDVAITDDLAGVDVTVALAPWVAPHLVDSARFWVVRPRVGAQGISGLGTLMSGVYIAFEPGKSGKKTKTFKGLELPPIAPADAAGLKIKLESKTLSSINVSTSVYFRQIQVGQVERYRLRDDRIIEIDVYIEPKYALLVRENSVFWNAGGLDLSLTAAGMNLSVESLDSLVTGGIAFDTLEDEPLGDPATAKEAFKLFDSRPTQEDLPTQAEPFVVYFAESTRGLTVDAPVEFRGTILGKVTHISLEYVLDSGEFRTRVQFETSPGRIKLIGQDDAGVDEEIDRLIQLGLRARLETGSLLTGARFIDLDLYPDSAVALETTDESLPQIPSIPSTGETIENTLSQLPEIVGEFKTITTALAALVESPDVKATLANARDASKNLDELLKELTPLAAELRPFASDLRPTVDKLTTRVEAILTEVEGTSAAARKILTSADGAVAEIAASTPAIRTRLLAALEELSSSLRAVRVLADYLERHPEALIQGKPGSGADR